MGPDAEDDFGLSSGDDAELLELAEVAEISASQQNQSNGNANGGRKHVRSTSSQGDIRPAKVLKQDGKASPQEALDVALNILNTRFKLPKFRLKQELAITRVLTGGSAVVVFPTGGGKSLCYQVPGVAFKPLDRIRGDRQGHAEGGITLVVSPLLALMKDQVDALKRLGVRAAALDSTKTRDEYLATVDQMREGTLDLLYCAPERLNNEGFVASMANVKGGVRLLAVDEAHCISEWGHAFRPDYLKVARFAKEIQAERVLCLTATATPKVAADVCKAFDIPMEGLFKTPTYRPNLKLQARSFLTKEESYPELIRFLNGHMGPTIIYVTLQKHAEALSERLRKSGIKSRHFHAGMQKEEKESCQDEFMRSKNLVICATIAFGMGIDKADIRNVIHYDIPRSLEGYSQEIGRAGRDGLQSHCMLYMCAEDFHLRESFARGDLPSKSSVTGLLQEIFDSKPLNGSIETSLFQQSKDYDIKQTVLKNIFAQLELRFGLLRETTPRYTTYQYKQIKPTFFDKSPVAEDIRNASKQAKVWTSVDVDLAARNARVGRVEIISKLTSWDERGLIALDAKGVQNVYRVLKPLPTSSKEQQTIIDALYKELEVREQHDLARMDEVSDLITGRQCFARTLAQHFGDSLPDEKTECGSCTWCETHQPVEMKKPPTVPWNSKAFLAVLNRVPERDDPRYLARVAFGISSPRVTQAKLAKDPVFGSMEDHQFTVGPIAFSLRCALLTSYQGTAQGFHQGLQELIRAWSDCKEASCEASASKEEVFRPIFQRVF